jgi:ribonuclease HII
VARSTGQRLLAFDRRLGVRFVAGADEAGRGSLAGPLVVAGVLFDYELLRGARVRLLAALNDSKQVSPDQREVLFESVAACASAISMRVVPSSEIDRSGLHRSNLAGLRAVLSDLHPPAEACLVDGFRLGPTAPPHQAIVDGDARSATIAAASIVAKVMRDRVMRRLDALYPRYGFVSHVGYITPAHSRAVRAFGPSALHRRSFQAACYMGGPGEMDSVPVDSAGRRDAESSVAFIRPVWALPASLPRRDQRNPIDEARSARPSAA